jgi:hypothetical protein
LSAVITVYREEYVKVCFVTGVVFTSAIFFLFYFFGDRHQLMAVVTRFFHILIYFLGELLNHSNFNFTLMEILLFLHARRVATVVA